MPEERDNEPVEKLIKKYGETPVVSIRPAEEKISRGETPIVTSRPSEEKEDDSSGG
jgi:hypothetical protein